MVLIKELIIKNNISIELTDTIEFAINIMSKNKQGVVVVLTKNVAVGILTERDVLEIINSDIDFNSSVETVIKFNHLITINIKRSVDYALHVLIDNNIRRLIIVDDNNNFEGVITQDILIKHLEEDIFKTNIIISNFIKEKKDIVTLNQNETIKEAFKLMNKNNIGSLIAVDDDENLVGIVTENDTVSIINRKFNLDSRISEVMTSPIISVCESEKVNDVILFMDQEHIRRVLVLNKDTKKGQSILSIRDIAHNLKGNYGKILESKLRNVKNTLNNIGESIIEVYEDNDEQIIQWLNDVSINNFGNVTDKNILSLIDEDIWSNIYKDIVNHDRYNKYKLKIDDKYYELSCSSHYVNKKDSLLLILRDISEFEYAVIDANEKNSKIYEELKILQGVIDQQTSIVIVTDGYEIISANQSLYSFYNVKNLQDFIKKYKNISDHFINHKNFFSHDDLSLNWVEEILKEKAKNRIVSILDLNSFEPKAFNIQVQPLSTNNKNYVITLTDITEIKLESQQYHYHATHDALTCIYNRSYYFEKIANEIEQAKRYKTTFCIVLFDIDHFKRFNDNYGHLVGDEVLVKLSQTIKLNTRSSDTFARWGGEEFIILLEKTTIDKAELIAEHFRKLIENMKIEGIEQITSSFGVTQFQKDDDDNTILKRADDALYMAKEAGRNKVVTL
ncbi:MAG: diguanylate cyclase [Campylobacterota bacterium]|nr:diguanylate cyclase [Campylobacterota bacterium]